MLKVLKWLFYIASFLFFMWILISWYDIVQDNMTVNPVHYPWNFFVVTFK